MSLRIGITLAICLCGALPAAAQHVVRFETTAGSFDMVLNPTNDPRLQGHVDNMIAYVRDHRYDTSWIHRAGETQTGADFVLQMGGFHSHTKRPPLTIDSTRPVSTFDSVTGVPARTIGLSNTVGTVALALPSDEFQNPLRNHGTGSFFINLGNNFFLDPDFTVFARIPDMTVVNQIMSLGHADLINNPAFAAGGFDEVPLTADGKQVFIKRAFLLTDALSVALARAEVQSAMALSAVGIGASAGTGGSGSPLVSTAVVPEPASAVMLLLGVLCLAGLRRRRN